MAKVRQQFVDLITLMLPPFRADAVIPARTDNVEWHLLLACSELARRAIKNADYRRQLTKGFGGTLDANGQIDIATISNGLSTPLPEGIRKARVFVEDNGYQCEWFDWERDVNSGSFQPDVPRFTVLDNTVRVLYPDGSVPALKDISIFNCIAVPGIHATNASLTTVPVTLEEDLMQITVELLLAQRGLAQTQ